MTMDFSPARWDAVKETYRRFYAHELKRPLVRIWAPGRDPGRPAPKLDRHPGYPVFYDTSVTPQEIIDWHDHDVRSEWILGDAYPVIMSDVAPGGVNLFLGMKVVPGDDEGTVWLFPQEDKAIADIRLEYRGDSPWYERLKAIYRAGVERWGGSVQISMTDLGGNLDIVSAWRPGDAFLLDLYDHPDEVKRLTWESHDAWWRYYEELHSILRPSNPGYTGWVDVFSEKPYYVLQCDFCYMLGPAMFDEFVKPELEATANRLGNCFYHLDGTGALGNLPSLLTIEKLDGVQWQMGDGRPGYTHWVDAVFRKVREAGKLCYVQCEAWEMEDIIRQLGSGEGVCFEINAWTENVREMKEFLAKHGVK